MNAKDIIRHKIEFLSGVIADDLDAESLKYVEIHPELQDELQFLESIWSAEYLSPEQQPSDALNARFYQMLSQAQSVQPLQSKQQTTGSKLVQEVPQKKLSLTATLSNWFNPKIVAQFALLVLVFFGGWLINHQPNSNLAIETTELKQQVKTLNTVVAISMLQNQSASERLAGVNYASQANGNDQKVTQLLISLINNDHSNAVRLAAINALASRSHFELLEMQLLNSISKQDNPLVQIALAQLAVSKNFEISNKEFTQLTSYPNLDMEVKEYLISNRERLVRTVERI